MMKNDENPHTRASGKANGRRRKNCLWEKKLFLENHRKFRWKILFIRKKSAAAGGIMWFYFDKKSLGKLTAFEASFVKFVSTGNTLLSSVDWLAALGALWVFCWLEWHFSLLFLIHTKNLINKKFPKIAREKKV